MADFRTCKLHLTGFTPYSPSRPFQSEPQKNERPGDFDLRCWREHAHVDSEGRLIIPASGIKQAIDNGAKRLQIKKVGKSMWTADITSGVDILDDLLVQYRGHAVLATEVPHVDIYCHSNGDRTSGSRVWRRFPVVPAPWEGTVTLAVFNETIPESVIEMAVKHAGIVSGLGRFRPEKSGSNGRFRVDFEWQEGGYELAA